MKILALCFVVLSFNVFANTDVEQTHNRLIGKAYYESIKLLMQAEGNTDPKYTQIFRLLLDEAYAGPGGGCLLSGWLGKLEGNRCRPDGKNFDEAKLSCDNSSENVGDRWTNACYNAFLKKNNFKDGDFGKLGAEILKDKSINLTTVVAESKRMCGNIARKGMDMQDCQKISKLYTEVVKFEKKILNCLASH